MTSDFRKRGAGPQVSLKRTEERKKIYNEVFVCAANLIRFLVIKLRKNKSVNVSIKEH
jgi:hypothetical protein